MVGHAWVPLEPLDWPNCVSLYPPHHPNCPHRCTVALSFWVFMIIENTNMKSHHPDCTHRWCCHFIDISGKWNIENPEFSRTEIDIPWNGPKDVQIKLLPGHNLEIIIFLSQAVFTVWLLLPSSVTSTSASLSTEIWLVSSTGPSGISWISFFVKNVAI